VAKSLDFEGNAGVIEADDFSRCHGSTRALAELYESDDKGAGIRFQMAMPSDIGLIRSQ
jgi:hypothetical protein